MGETRLTEHERLRRQLWVQIAVATAAACNTLDKSTVTSWANAALYEFDRQFPVVK